MEIQIETGVPLPSRKWNGSRMDWRKVFEAMKVGDSFYVPRKFFSAHIRHGRALGHVYTARRDGDGLRIWRVK